MNILVFKAFAYDLITSLATLVALWLTVPDNVSKLGISDLFVPVVVGAAGALLLAIRRYIIVNKQ